jgi:formylglycine-generating enzyme required for sulfatase activity
MSRTVVMLAAVLLCATVAAAAPAVLRDPFTDGSGRTAPAVVVVPQLEGDVGARPEEPGYDASELRHRVVLSPYAIGRTEVTNRELAAFLSEAGNQSDVDGGPWLDLAVTGQIAAVAGGFAAVPGAEDKPAAGITWNGARAYCRWLSKKTGVPYDLPTAAEWEVAARAGTASAWWWGDADDPRRYRSIAGGEGAAAATASYPPNPWGIHDTSGNVWEWTLDCYAGDFPLVAPVRDPRLVDDRCLTPEIRGGSFRDGGPYSRPAYRSNAWWTTASEVLGFRVVRRLQAAAGAAAGARSLQLVWKRSGKPASVLAIVGAAASPAAVPANGTIALPASGATLQIVDPASGLVLFDGPPPAASPLQLPEPVRLRATLAGVAAGAVPRVRIGYGPRAAAMERWLRATGSQAPRDERMTSAYGIALPPSPLAWRDAIVDGASVDGGWFLATDAPQLVAFDSAGGVLVADVAVPAAIDAHAVLDAGTLTLRPSNAIDVDVPLPSSDLPVPILLGVTGVTIDAAAKADAGRLLSALDQIEPRLFALLVLDHGITLSFDGKARLRPLPRFNSVTLLMHEPFSAAAIPRDVPLTAGVPAVVHLERGSGGVFRATAPGKFSGRLTARGAGVANATVVVSDYPARRETVTAADGSFSVDGIRNDGAVTVFADASRGGVPAGIAAVHIFRDVAASSSPELALPLLPAIPQADVPRNEDVQTPKTGKCQVGNDAQYGGQNWLGFRDTNSDDDFYVFNVHLRGQTAQATVCGSGTWAFWFAPTPFEIYNGAPSDFGTLTNVNCPRNCADNCTGYNVALVDIPFAFNQVIQLVDSRGNAVADDVEVLFSPPGPFQHDWDPTPLSTDANGQVILCKVNVNPVHIFYEGAFGHTDCDVKLTSPTVTVRLDGTCR